MKSLVCFITLFIAISALAAVPSRLVRDIKLPTQVVLESDTITTPLLYSDFNLANGWAGITSTAAQTLTVFDHQPDVPRNITIETGGDVGDVGSCTIVATGTDINDKVITESFVLTIPVQFTGTKAFKTVTSIVFPAACENSPYGVVWYIGVGSKLGLRHCMKDAGDLLYSKFNHLYETTRGTAVADPDTVSLNTFTAHGTLDGAKTVVVNYFQNYHCL